MTKQSPHDLFPQRPIRSDFGRRSSGPNYALRRFITICVLLALAVGIGLGVSKYFSSSSSETESTDVPVIKAEMPIKQKPDQPGGIDIPHQDVTVFQQLDNKRGGGPNDASGVEHLLPVPETPQAVPAAVGGNPQPSTPIQTESMAKMLDAGEELPPAVTEAAAPIAATMESKPQPVKEEVKKVEDKKIIEKKAKTEASKTEAKAKAEVKKIESKAAPKAEAKTVEGQSHLPTEMFTNDAFSPASPSAVKETPKTAPVSGVSGKKAMAQLASLPDEATAQKELKRFQTKYASALSGVSLRVVKADIPGKGTYYRVMSESVADTKAKNICADVTKLGGSCIVAR